MKRKNPYLMMATLLCALFFSSCQKEANVLPQGSTANRLLSDPIDPINTGMLVPLAGNAFITKPASGGTEAITSAGLSNWKNSNAITSTYFRIGTPGQLFIGINASVPSGTSTIKVIVNGVEFTVKNITGSTYSRYRVGLINITSAGYVKVDLQGVSNSNNSKFADVSDIVIYGPATQSNVSFANDPAHYNDSRAGASVKLQYNIPSGTNAQWFYNEVTVPTAADKAGSNYISNGFDAGYAGLQVTTSGEKRITFFVSNTATNAAKLVRAGAGTTLDVTVRSGKSLYIPFNWAAGTTYKFITQAKSDLNGNTSFTSWVYTPEDAQWKLIASCSRANSGSYLTGLYSSLQGTNAENGFAGRSLRCYNQWINTNNTWTEVTEATFKGDATAMNNQRLDYNASVSYSAFYLKSQGFFPDNSALNSSLMRAGVVSQPGVDLISLP